MNSKIQSVASVCTSDKHDPHLPMVVSQQLPVPISTNLPQILGSPIAIDLRLKKSDESIVDTDNIDARVEKFIQEHGKEEVLQADESAVILSGLRHLYKEAEDKIYEHENTASKNKTVKRILNAKLLTYERKWMNVKHGQWLKHYKATYGSRGLRSCQDYMRLAEIDSSLQWAKAGAGRERLVACLRAKKELKFKGIDPFSALLAHFNISVDPADLQNDDRHKDLCAKIDIALALSKIKKAETEHKVTISADTSAVQRLISEGKPIDGKLISDLVTIAKESADAKADLEELCRDENPHEVMLARVNKADGFNRLVKALKQRVSGVQEDEALRSRIDIGEVRALQESIIQMISLIEENDPE